MGIYLGDQLLSYTVPCMDTMPIGTVIPWFSDAIPVNFLLLDGQAVSRSTYFELFSIWGTRYGTGDGVNTFNVVDMRGVVPVGKDSSQPEFDAIGTPSNYKGEKTHLLTAAESGLPAHSHTLPRSPVTWPAGGSGDGWDGWGTKNPYVNSISATNGSTAANASQAHNNLPPYKVCNWIVKALNAVPSSALRLDGWNPANETWTCVSANVMTIAGNQTGKYGKGDKLRWVQNNNFRYGNIVSISYAAGTNLTTVTKHAGYLSTPGDCDVLNTTTYPISDNCYSKIENPQGFPNMFNYTPAIGASGNMTVTSLALRIAKFKLVGASCHMIVRGECTLGGTGDVFVTATLPVTPAYQDYQAGWGYCYLLTGIGECALPTIRGDSKLSIARTAGAAWTTGNSRGFYGEIEYEI